MPRKRNRYNNFRKGSWKLIDDRTGFVIYSHEAVFDAEEPNVITTKEHADPLDLYELPRPVHPNEEGPPPFTRPEDTDTFRDGATKIWSLQTKSWVEDGDTWDTNETNYEASSGNWED